MSSPRRRARAPCAVRAGRRGERAAAGRHLREGGDALVGVRPGQHLGAGGQQRDRGQPVVGRAPRLERRQQHARRLGRPRPPRRRPARARRRPARSARTAARLPAGDGRELAVPRERPLDVALGEQQPGEAGVGGREGVPLELAPAARRALQLLARLGQLPRRGERLAEVARQHELVVDQPQLPGARDAAAGAGGGVVGAAEREQHVALVDHREGLVALGRAARLARPRGGRVPGAAGRPAPPRPLSAMPMKISARVPISDAPAGAGLLAGLAREGHRLAEAGGLHGHPRGLGERLGAGGRGRLVGDRGCARGGPGARRGRRRAGRGSSARWRRPRRSPGRRRPRRRRAGPRRPPRAARRPPATTRSRAGPCRARAPRAGGATRRSPGSTRRGRWRRGPARPPGRRPRARRSPRGCRR